MKMLNKKEHNLIYKNLVNIKKKILEDRKYINKQEMLQDILQIKIATNIIK